MSITISFLAGEGFTINDMAGSGLGFYGDSGFGASVRVGEYQGRTFITNGAGSTQGPEADNVKYVNAGSGVLGQTGSGIALTAIPNHQATLEVRLTSDTAVQVQSARLYGYDRHSINNPPSGVTLKGAEIIHPTQSQTNNGSGDTTWVTMAGTGSYLSLANSPGVSGQYAGNGSNSTRPDTVHSWFAALSASPNSVGAKTQFGLMFETEYL
jgi:hypothetical protein